MGVFNDWRDWKATRRDPSANFKAYTKSDAGTIGYATRWVMVGADATLAVKPTDAATASILLAGRVMYPLSITQVFTTGTDSVAIFVGQ